MGIADSNETKYWSTLYGLDYAEHTSMRYSDATYPISKLSMKNWISGDFTGAKYWQEYFKGSNVQSFNVMISVVQHFAPNSYGCEHMLCP